MATVLSWCLSFIELSPSIQGGMGKLPWVIIWWLTLNQKTITYFPIFMLTSFLSLLKSLLLSANNLDISFLKSGKVKFYSLFRLLVSRKCI